MKKHDSYGVIAEGVDEMDVNMYPSKLYGIIADAIEKMEADGLYYQLVRSEEQESIQSAIEILWNYMRTSVSKH